MNTRVRWSAAALLLACCPLAAEEPVQIEMRGTSIIGDQELPKVLYIVPWKNARFEPDRLPPEAPGAGDLLEPLQRHVVQRELRYRKAMSDFPEGE